MKFSSEAKRPSYAEGILFSLDSYPLLSFWKFIPQYYVQSYKQGSQILTLLHMIVLSNLYFLEPLFNYYKSKQGGSNLFVNNNYLVTCVKVVSCQCNFCY